MAQTKIEPEQQTAQTGRCDAPKSSQLPSLAPAMQATHRETLCSPEHKIVIYIMKHTLHTWVHLPIGSSVISMVVALSCLTTPRVIYWPSLLPGVIVPLRAKIGSPRM